MKDLTFWIYLFILSGSTYLIRAVPFSVFTKKIENRFLHSFLTYIPYAVLTAMTLPAVLYSTDYMASALVGLAIAIILAFKGKGLTFVAIYACIGVFVTELFIGA